MSQIQVDSIQSKTGGPVIVSLGATIPSGQTLSADGDLSISGIITATSFVGSGAGITNIPVVLQSASLARVLVRV
jgi:hypothetical protein